MTQSEQRQIYDPVDETPTSYVREPDDAHPPMDYEGYKSTALRHPKRPLVYMPQTISEITGPQLGAGARRRDRQRPHDPARGVADRRADHRLGACVRHRRQAAARTRWSRSGRRTRRVVTFTSGTAGRPISIPNFSGAGRCLTDSNGRYQFTTIKPGPYPWGNHYNAWRPAHIHFSLLGRAFTQRLVTQMYFPGDPLFPYDPIFNSVRDPAARERMISRFSIHDTVPNWALAYEFDICLRGPGQTPFEESH